MTFNSLLCTLLLFSSCLPLIVIAKEKQQSTWIPILGSTSTYGFFVGAAQMTYPKGRYGYFLSLRGMATMHPFWNGGVSYKKWSKSGSILRTNFSYSGWFDPYYGEGVDTKPEDRVDILYHYATFQQDYLLNINEHLAYGGFLESRYREERGTLDDANKSYFPLEHTPAVGLLLEWDTRNNRFSPTEGSYHQAKWRWYPGSGSNQDTIKEFHQWEMDFRFFKSLGAVKKKSLVWATRLSYGHSEGDPSYVYRYSVGGPYSLRGFQKNRFRGKKFYGWQNELRIPFRRYISFVAFGEVGDVTDSNFGRALTTYGGGFRFGLPPDFEMQVRLDFGFSEDQSSVSFLFDHAY